MSGATLRAGRRAIPISHPDRLVFPEAGLTKMDLARHYADVAPVMVPHVRGRPLALQSFPQGIDGAGFFLKDAPRHFPDWIATADVPKRDGGTVRHVLADDAATLVYLAGQNVVTPHVWTSRADRLERPDRLIFDLDPTLPDFAAVRRAALRLGVLLRGIGMEPFAMTTGSRGLHVVTPLRRTADFGPVQKLAVTATATARVREDIARALRLEKPATVWADFARGNLRTGGKPSGEACDIHHVGMIDRHLDLAGIEFDAVTQHVRGANPVSDSRDTFVDAGTVALFATPPGLQLHLLSRFQ